MLYDEELPDYIMVMVANKKNPKQMADDLSLFLGSNTIKFTVWLHGVLEKLRSVATEPTSLHPSDPHSETSIPAENNRRAAEPRALAISSSRSDKLEGRVSSSAHENRTSRRGSSERPSRLTSAVKPLMEASAEAVIDIKPDLDDDLIAYDPMEQSLTSQALYSRSTADRPRPALESSRRTADAYRSSDVTRGQERSGSSHGRGYRSSAESSRELSRKRKAPVASSVVRVHRGHERGQESDDLNEEEDEDEEDYGIASKVSLPLKPERKPSLPPAKQANKNLILKAISEAQKSINKTTTYTVPQRQTVPVAPRTRSASDEMNNAAIRLVQEHLHALTPQDTLHNTQSIALASRLQLDLPEEDTREQLSEYREGYDLTLTSDSKVHLSCTMEVIQSHSVKLSSLMSERGELVEAASPKFIVTLDGVPSPLASRTDQEIEPEDEFNTTPDFPENNGPKPAVHLRLGTDFLNTGNRELNEVEDMDVEPVQAKRQKLPERCRFWPACKSGDECLYHHPNTQCKIFPNCKFGNKCLFIHPNCKFDAKCTKADCPFTHVSRKLSSNPTRADPAPASSVCHFFPECKKLDCPFYHPKPCRFAAQCKRAGCTFYHPAVAVPPRSALKWTKTQNS
ncbi:zinc finger CCCH domain-containing protein 14-like [Sinocyclocheilus grahami]|uniref:zinc finger CCCH domain-containing protein 14-like n=1 Tax=Sinocyclocheilus grahami TaxID=75366 RepID=UPI0007ACD894|nr:PREDICTED: zinc finger CCCH domain-containing protein 14-like [Sinocyclocheilus grahami]